jgi:hypothetical protein
MKLVRLLHLVVPLIGCTAPLAPKHKTPATSTSTGVPEPAPAIAPHVISTASWSSAESDPFLSVSPMGTIATAWLALTPSSTSLGYAFSDDGGATWTDPRRLDSPNGHDSSDPALVPDDDGGFYLTWTPVDTTSYEADSVYVAHARSSAEAFGSLVEVTDPSLHLSYDQPKIYRTASGALLVTYNRRANDSASTPNQIGISRSADGGGTWQRSILAAGSGYRNQAFFCGQTPSGRVLVLYADGASGLVLRGSDDDGATWSTVSNPLPLASAHHLEFEPVCAVAGSDVWVLYSRGAPNATFDDWKSSSIEIVHSVDGGATFDPPAFALDPNGPPYSKHATLAINPASGALDVVYYAGASDSDMGGTVRFVQSKDAGQTFGASLTLGSALFTAKRDWPLWMGDYMGAGLYAPGQALVIAYSDGSSGNAHVFAVSTPDPYF